MQGIVVLDATSCFFDKLPFEELDKFRFKEHFMERDQDLNDHEHYFTQRVDKPDSVFDFQVFSQHLRLVQINEIFKFTVDVFELVSDEFLKHKNVFVLVNVIQTIDI